MAISIVFVFAAMVEFAIVNTLARKEIKRMSMRIRSNNKGKDDPDVVSDNVYFQPDRIHNWTEKSDVATRKVEISY